MKLKHYSLWALALAFAAVSCSDDLENSGKNGTDDGNSRKAYMTINISTVSDGIKTKADPDNVNPDGGAGWGEDGNGWLGELPGKNEGMVYDINVFLVQADVNNRNLDLTNQLNLFNQKIENENSVRIAGHGYYDLQTSEGKGLDASEGGEEDHHGSRNVTITMEEDLGENEEYFQVFTIVNAGKPLNDIETLKALREYLYNDNKEVNITTSVADADKFIMSTHKMISSSGNLKSVVALSNKNTAGNPAKTAVYVERLAARIDLAYPNDGTLEFNNTNSPVNGKGEFKLTNYMVVNQWKGGTNMFKQVSPTVTDETEEVNINNDYITTPYKDPLKYLGDEIWSKTEDRFNFVLSDEFTNKTKANVRDTKWKNLYTNYFDGDLNNANKLNSLPSSLYYDEKMSETSNRRYYPIAYVWENTMNTKAQLNGYSTGVIFQTQFTPNEQFKLTKYNDDKIELANLTKDADGKFHFFTAEHFNGTEVEKLVYEDVKSVAARAFKLANGTTPQGLLKGFMDGWTSTTITLGDVQTAVAGMSEKNLLSKKFKTYLNGWLENKNEFTDDLKNNMTYDAFVQTQTSTQQELLNGNKELKNYSPSDIENLAKDYGIYFFRDGKSYHKFWIRHDDNNDDYKMGVMEFAIVRNNVYQLYVKGVRGLGDPLPFTPGKDDPDTPDESNEVTIEVTIYVKDWVKRVNKPIIL